MKKPQQGESVQPNQASSLKRVRAFTSTIRTVASIIRDIGLIIGIPTLTWLGIQLYEIQSKALEQQIKANEAQIKALEAQNTFLKETQFDRALVLIKAKKELYEAEKYSLEKEISDLKKAGESGAERVSILQSQLSSLNARITTDYKTLQGLSKTYFTLGDRFDPAWYSKNVSFQSNVFQFPISPK